MLSWSSIKNNIRNSFFVTMGTTKMSILVDFSYVYWLPSNNMQNSEQPHYILNI